jgi:hypothetical protein
MYQVHVVSDDELPRGVRRVLVQRESGDPLLILSESAAKLWRRPARLDVPGMVDDEETVVLREVVNRC